MNQVSMDSLVIILLCSNLGLSHSTEKLSKPYTIVQWHNLSERIRSSSLKRPEALLSLSEKQLQETLFLSVDESKRIVQLLARKANIAIEIERLSSKGIYIITRADKNYPKQLKKKLLKKAPPLIYYAGNITLANKPSIAVVGSRKIDSDDENFTRLVTKKAVELGYCIVSGGAKGVDSIAEQTSINNNGNTISVVSDTLSKRILGKESRNAIIDGRLLMLSFVHPDTSFKGYNAMDRNKYVYVLSEGAVIVTSAFKTGGTWAGAIENRENSWVPMFVQKNERMSQGNAELVSIGAFPITIQELEANKPDLFKKHICVGENIADNGIIGDKRENVIKQLTMTLL